ncbi:hypothetical protein P691DRAFT_733886 [Macrolepiota fuliginosa MF-IS2]|uniref:DUF6593 domain-containing protein n=1 Tax=Macrolepiota fuliginosa MF-IS2 TaxID=1400762 RepID=A0A9P5X7S0_9AGAR|nr:hypothetical protein P691DRAFT_733886 [Macrolepiota fuliginosa MF-IS2]
MFGNPYAQGGWFNPETHSLPLPDQRHSPTFGALPHYIPVLSPNIITFLFSGPDQDILNCDVTDASFQKSYTITTNKRGFGETTIKRADGEISGVVDWQRYPEVEVFRSFQKQRASTLLELSSDGSGRFMGLRDKRYFWKILNDTTSLYPLGGEQGDPIVKITRINQGVLLEITTSAVQVGLLDIAVMVTVLLHSGRRFD